MRQSLLNRASHILYPAGRARRGIAAALASVCSVSLFAAGVVTLSTLTSLRPAYAAGAGAYAMNGEVLVWVPEGISSTRVAELAASAGCEVVYNISSPSQYYLLRVKGTSRSRALAGASAASRAEVVPGINPVQLAALRQKETIDTISRYAGKPTPAVLKAITTLKAAQPGLLADPNWVAFSCGMPLQTPPATTVTPNDTYYPVQWDMDMINMPTAWALQSGTKDTIVAVIDTGFDDGHPDFELNGVRNYLDSIDVSTGGVVSPGTDLQGHGTHVSGSVAAVVNNATGIAGIGGYNGGNTSIKLLGIKASFLDTGGFAGDAIIAGINEAVRRKAAVINMSLGGYGQSDVEAQAVASAFNAGTLIVAADGNDNVNMSLDTYDNSLINQNTDPSTWGTSDGELDQLFPAGFPNVIAVSSVGRTGRKAYYSNYGGTTTITAPGGAFETQDNFAQTLILSTYPRSKTDFTGPQAGYTYEQGTSMASPHVAGVAALLAAVGGTRDQIVATLKSTATKIDNSPQGLLYYGAGLLNAGEATRILSDPDPRFTLLGGSTVTTVPNGTITAVTDKGSSYFKEEQFTVQLIGVKKLIAAINADPSKTSLVLSIETATTPSSVVTSYTVPADTIPGLATGEGNSTTKTMTIPPTPLKLTQGKYKAVLTLTYNGVATSQVQYFELLDYVQPQGLAMFSIPFQPAATTSGISKEEQVLGISSNFSLSRFNPLPVVDGSGSVVKQPGYATYQPPTKDEIDARFSNLTYITDPLHTDRALVPLSFDVSSPTVSLAPIGVGYWINLGEQRTIAVSGSGANNSVGLPLFGLEDDQGTSRGISGWNLIGSPFAFPVNWSAVTVRVQSPIGVRDYSLSEAIAAELIGPALVGYDPQVRSYVYNVAPAGQLLPFRGYWVRAMRDLTLIVPPNRSGQVSSRAIKAPTTSSGNQLPAMEGWRVRFAASVAGDRDAENYLGQVRGASDSEDRFDIPKPPSGPSHAYVRFLNNDKKGRKTALAFDMRSSESKRKKEEWTVAVGADKGSTDVTLTWDGLGGVPNRARLSLKDSVTGTVIPMNSRSSYTYRNAEAGATRMFTITMTPQASSGPLQIMNVRATTTRGISRSMNVEFTTTQDAEIQATVQTLSGKVVNVLTGPSRSADQSKTVMRWDLRSREGSEVASGPYILEITARTDNGETATIKRPISILR